jgi:spectrin beta
LQAEHDDLKAEIETREKTFSTVVALGEAMVKENHSASKEVSSAHAQLFIDRAH